MNPFFQIRVNQGGEPPPLFFMFVFLRSAPLLIFSFLFVAVFFSGCGFKTPPRPVQSELPTVKGLSIWKREAKAVVRWQKPTKSKPLKGLEGYRIVLERTRLGCQLCPAESSEEKTLELDDSTLVVEKGLVYYLFNLSSTPAVWRVRVAPIFGRGRGPFSKSVFLEGLASVPPHNLGWKLEPPSGQGKQKRTRFARLFWVARRERILHVFKENQGFTPREEFYRANLYRKKQGQSWPLTPFNPEPLEVRQWVVPIPTGKTETPRVYALRLVDASGNESALSPPVEISLP